MIRVRGLKVWFSQRRGLLKDVLGSEEAWVKAVDGIDLDVRRREILCLVGESGCGKTTTGKALLRLAEPTDGDVLFEMPDDVHPWFHGQLADAVREADLPRDSALRHDVPIVGLLFAGGRLDYVRPAGAGRPSPPAGLSSKPPSGGCSISCTRTKTTSAIGIGQG